MTKLESLAKDCIENHTHRLVDKPTKQDIYLREESIFIQGYRQSEKRITELESTNKKISDECHKLVDSLEKKQNENELLETQNIKLQAEVSRLTIKNSELKADNDARKFAMAMSENVEKQLRNERNTFLAQNEQYEKDLIDFNETLTKATDIIKKLKALYFSPVVTKDDVKRQNEILEEAEQFLKDSEVEK